MRRATSRERGGAIARRRAPARVTYALERQAAHDEGLAFRNLKEAPTRLSFKDRLFYSFIVRDGDRHSAADQEFARPIEARHDPNDRSICGRVLQRSEVGDEDLRACDVRKRQRYEAHKSPHALVHVQSKFEFQRC